MSTSPLSPDGAEPGTANRHGRAADAFITSYLRELMADDEPAAAAPAATAADVADVAASDEPATLL